MKGQLEILMTSSCYSNEPMGKLNTDQKLQVNILRYHVLQWWKSIPRGVDVCNQLEERVIERGSEQETGPGRSFYISLI
ncbi:hypothetical protein TNCT_659441 [Trichonephila clavata]|uniref:Uncharacterized protein n=1 Tax=Trichonephila clavata TaxID=2740835 RepID=A0A8X6F4I0_TRICU|nr:hypothetical protein TNCT_659441 [Trichonephila clavata]